MPCIAMRKKSIFAGLNYNYACLQNEKNGQLAIPLRAAFERLCAENFVQGDAESESRSPGRIFGSAV